MTIKYSKEQLLASKIVILYVPASILKMSSDIEEKELGPDQLYV